MKQHSFKKRPCKYCKITHKKPYAMKFQKSETPFDCGAWIHYDSTNGNFEILVEYDSGCACQSLFTNINYCPACGRKLDLSA